MTKNYELGNMDLEFHYYINLIIAKIAGFDDLTSNKIAYSAQFVDDNTKKISVSINDSSIYYTSTITQTFNLKLPKKELKEIYTSYHFQPQASLSDKFWVTKAASKIAKTILSKALTTNSPYLIGIASHAYADTYAHQNFIGFSHSFNNPLSSSLIPSYGHMCYGELPDMIGVKWYDSRCNKIVDNNKRFIKCAMDLLSWYCKYNNISKNEFDYKKNTLANKLEKIFGDSEYYIHDYKYKKFKRIESYKRMLNSIDYNYTNEYDPCHWIDQAIYYCATSEKWIPLNGFKNSHWYKFQQKAKIYKKLVSKIINSNINLYDFKFENK